ncbi:MAG: HEAT repeat domain-containing protein [Methanomicrobiaceae archaeon]|nr:HEAT repeat domain-containing protein [Methanomicrobiaceae archaeon]
MQGSDIRSSKKADIELFKEKGEIGGLLRFLKDWDPEIRWLAADALGSLGKEATGPLIRQLKRKNRYLRLGVIEALAQIGDPDAVPPLESLLSTEKRIEIRFLTAVALGEIGDLKAVPVLEALLSDRSKYVRFGAASALDQLGWKPGTVTEDARYRIAKQDWEGAIALGDAAIVLLEEALGDPDRQIRLQVIDLLGRLPDEKGEAACRRAVTDPDPDVRWHAVCPRCGPGSSLLRLTMAIMHRARPGKSPAVAALLNLLFLGLGYNYVGKWWGFLLFQLNITFILLFSFLLGPLLPQLLSLSVSSVCSVHAFQIASRRLEGL